MVKLGNGSHPHGQPWLQHPEVAVALGCQSWGSAGHQRGPRQSQARFWGEWDCSSLVQLPSIWLSNCYPDPLQCCVPGCSLRPPPAAWD